jgi:hypothetical protein
MKHVFFLFILIALSLNAHAGEATVAKAQHRLPPVIYSLQIPKAILPNRESYFKWSVMGYHDTYDVSIAIYCEAGSCEEGKHNKKNGFVTGKTVSPSNIDKGAYSWGDVQSKKFDYSTKLSVDFSKSQNFVVRFFVSPPNDPIDTSSLSLIIPGGLGYEPGDSTGRKIKISGTKSGSERAWSYLFQEARKGDIILFAPEKGCEDGDCFDNATYPVGLIDVPYGYFSHAAIVYDKDFDDGSIRLLQARNPTNGVGADYKSDVINYSVLVEKPWERIVLYRVNRVSNLWANKVRVDAYEQYNNTKYSLTSNGTYCSKLVKDAYADYVDLSEGVSFFSFGTLELYLPDHITESKFVEMVRIWDKPDKGERRETVDRLYELPADNPIRMDIEKFMLEQQSNNGF